MTLRVRFVFTFLGIIALFTFNTAVYMIGNSRRAAAVEDLRRATARQSLLASVQLTLNDTQKQIGVLSQIASEAAAAGASPIEKSQFAGRLQAAENDVAHFRELSSDSASVADFEKSFKQLSASWQVFYDNFGENQTKAITELALRGDPLSTLVIQNLLPKLQREEVQREQTAGDNFRSVSRVSDQMTFSAFFVSAFGGLIILWLIARDIGGGLKALSAGAVAVGGGNLDYRINLRQQNELGDLAKAFDDMASRLGAARRQLTAAHQEEKQKSEALANALDELKKTQDRLLVQQKLASLGTLTAGIAHEIKNPLNFVANFSGILRSLIEDAREMIDSQKDRMDPEKMEFINETLTHIDTNAVKIREHATRADNIVKGMLMHSRGQRGQIQATNLNSLVSEYIKLAYHGLRALDINFNVTIEEDYDPAIPTLNLIPHDLSRVILNIANNGAFAAYQKAKRLGDRLKPTLRVKTKNLGNQVEIRIWDNGDGIPEEIRQKIFEPFFTTKPAGSGTGLGLSMSYEIVVKQHGGELRVETEAGRFAEFIITLPRT